MLRQRTGRIDHKAKQNIKKGLDEATSLYARERDGWRCRKCGRKRNQYTLDAHHIAVREQMPTRWDPLNLVSLCKLPCHDWATNNPDAARFWACELLGEDVYDAIVTHARGRAGYKVWDLEEMLEAYKRGEPISRVSEMLEGVAA